MLEKNKDYVEFTLQCTTVERSRDRNYREVCFNGYSDSDFPGVPMDVVCKEFNHKVVMISKRDFDRLQADNRHYRERAKQWEENHNLLLKKTGFDTVESLVLYLNNVGQDTLLNTLASYISERDKALEECEVMKKKLEEWRKATYCSSPLDAKNLIEETKAANEKFVNDVKSWQNVTGYSTPEDCMRARLNITTPFDYTAACQIATEQLCCGRDLRHNLQVDLECYRAISSTQGKYIYSWKEATGCDTPDQAKSHIEDLENGIRLLNKNMLKELDSEIEEWQKATGCNIPEQSKERIKALNERINELEADYNHLLCTTGFESEGEIEDVLDKCDHSTLRKALVDYEFDYEELLKLTGYKSNQDIRVALNHSEQFVYETMRELINSLKRQAKYTNLNWQNSTGFVTPEKCGEYIKKLEDKLHRINGISEEA